MMLFQNVLCGDRPHNSKKKTIHHDLTNIIFILKTLNFFTIYKLYKVGFLTEFLKEISENQGIFKNKEF